MSKAASRPALAASPSFAPGGAPAHEAAPPARRELTPFIDLHYASRTLPSRGTKVHLHAKRQIDDSPAASRLLSPLRPVRSGPSRFTTACVLRCSFLAGTCQELAPQHCPFEGQLLQQGIGRVRPTIIWVESDSSIRSFYFHCPARTVARNEEGLRQGAVDAWCELSKPRPTCRNRASALRPLAEKPL